MKARPKIAMIAAGPDIIGGHGVQANLLMEGLRKEGYEVGFLPTNPRFPPGLHWLRRLPYVRTLVNQAFYLTSLFQLRRVGVVHAFAASYWSFLLAPVPAMLAARTFRKRAILNYHSGEAEDHLNRWGLLVHPWLRLADEIVVPSDYLQKVFAKHGHAVRVIRNIVDTHRFHYRERNPLRPRLLSNRNLEPHYRVNRTVQAFALLKTHFPEATLTIAGGGSQEKTIRRLAHSLGVDGIQCIGRIEPEAMPCVYDEADIFVNSSVIDNQPISLLEAFASGLPVVTTGPGDIPSMVRHGETGMIIPLENPEAMAVAVRALLEKPDLALAMARRAREEVEHFSWSRVRGDWADVYAVTAT